MENLGEVKEKWEGILFTWLAVITLISFSGWSIREDLRMWSVFAGIFALLLYINLREVKDNQVLSSPFSPFEKVMYTVAIYLYYSGAFLLLFEAITEKFFRDHSAIIYKICSTVLFFMIACFFLMCTTLVIAAFLPKRIRIGIQSPRVRAVILGTIFCLFIAYSLIETVNNESLTGLQVGGGFFFALASIAEILLRLMNNLHRQISCEMKFLPPFLASCGFVFWITDFLSTVLL